jgi:hypothetical protein
LLPDGRIEATVHNNASLKVFAFRLPGGYLAGGIVADAWWKAKHGLEFPATERRVIACSDKLDFSQTSGAARDFMCKSNSSWGVLCVDERISGMMVARDVYLMDFIQYPLEYVYDGRIGQLFPYKWRRFVRDSKGVLNIACAPGGSDEVLGVKEKFPVFRLDQRGYELAQGQEVNGNRYKLIGIPPTYRELVEHTQAGVETVAYAELALKLREVERGTRIVIR